MRSRDDELFCPGDEFFPPWTDEERSMGLPGRYSRAHRSRPGYRVLWPSAEYDELREFEMAAHRAMLGRALAAPVKKTRKKAA